VPPGTWRKHEVYKQTNTSSEYETCHNHSTKYIQFITIFCSVTSNLATKAQKPTRNNQPPSHKNVFIWKQPIHTQH